VVIGIAQSGLVGGTRRGTVQRLKDYEFRKNGDSVQVHKSA
jgi:hypothetical protein